MYIEYVKNRNSPGCLLLRESSRVGRQVRKRTLANLTHWRPELVAGLRRLLAGGDVGNDPGAGVEIVRSLPYGHVAAVLGTVRRLHLDALLGAAGSRERALVLAMIVARVIAPESKLATARDLDRDTAFSALARELAVGGAGVNDLYAALDWLLPRQPRLERALAARHLPDGGLALYDATATWYEGRTCPLATFGQAADGRRGQRQIKFGLLCAPDGVPVAVEVFPGNIADALTIGSQLTKLRATFGVARIVLVGDRGMITQARLREELLAAHDWLDWITALRAPAVQRLARQGLLQLGLFDQTDLAELTAPEYPGERLVVCRNPRLAVERARQREALLQATEAALAQVAAATRRPRRPLRGAARIGLRVGRVLNTRKVGKHFTIEITDVSLAYHRDQAQITAEAALDGIYVIRTSLDATQMSATAAVAAYQRLCAAEQAFRCMKTVDLHVRPLRHRRTERVRAHVFLCLLAYYVEWHLRQAWAPLLFEEDDPAAAAAARASIVAPAQRSPSAQRKAATQRTADDYPVHSFQSLLKDLATITRNDIQPAAPGVPMFTKTTVPTPLQRRALDLLHLAL